MSSTIKNVILIGAGGNLGPSILEALDKDPQFIVSILSRKSSKSTFPSHIKVHTVDDSYPEKELVEAFTGQDAVISVVSHGGGIEKQIEIINAAVAAGVKRFIPSDFGSDTRHPKALAFMPLFNAKNDIVDYLKTQESRGLSWTAVTTGAFFDWGLKMGFLGFDLNTSTALIYDSGDAKFSVSTLATIGAAIAGILHKPEETANKYLFVSSFTTTQNEVLSVLENATEKKWKIEHTTTAELIQAGQEKLGKGDHSGALNIVLGIIFGTDTGTDFGLHKELSNELLGLPKETVEETVEEIVKGRGSSGA